MKIALIGNPNVEKSVLFGFLTGRRTTVSNYPGINNLLASCLSPFKKHWSRDLSAVDLEHQPENYWKNYADSNQWMLS